MSAESIGTPTKNPISISEAISLSGRTFGDEVLEAAVDLQDGSPEMQGQAAVVLNEKLGDLRANIYATPKVEKLSIHEAFRELDASAFPVDTENIVDYLYQAGDTDLIRFTEFLNARLCSLYDAFERDKQLLTESTLGRVAMLEGESFFPAGVLDKFGQTIDAYGDIIALDSFDVGAHRRVGYHWYNAQKIVLANLYDDTHNMCGTGDYLKHTVFHEYLHATGYKSESGFMSNGRQWHRWLEEAFVEHASVVSGNLNNPQSQIVGPYERSDWDVTHSYFDERELLGLLTDEGEANIPVDLLADAHFSQADSKTRRVVFDRLNNFFAGFAGYDVDQPLNAFSDSYESGSSDQRAKIIAEITNEINGYDDDDLFCEFDEMEASEGAPVVQLVLSSTEAI